MSEKNKQIDLNSKKKSRTMEEDLYRAGLVVLLISIPAGLFYFFVFKRYLNLPCVMDTLLGLYCPGCGGTRAIMALIHGKILLSIWYHPIVLYGVVMYSGFMISHTFEKLKLFRIRGWKFHEWYLYVAMAILLGNWILKNILRVFFHIEM